MAPFDGHLVPGVGLVILGIVLIVLYDPDKDKLLSKPFLQRATGLVLMIIAIVFAFTLMIEQIQGNYESKFHRVLTMLVFPLGLLMVQYDDIRWKMFMPIFCFLNTILYYGHQHHEGEEASMSTMPTPEEQAHNFFFVSFLLAGILYMVAFLYKSELNTFFNGVASMLIVVVGVWYMVIAFTLYGGYYGLNGVNYDDATADFGIVLLVCSVAMITGWLLWHDLKEESPLKKLKRENAFRRNDVALQSFLQSDNSQI